MLLLLASVAFLHGCSATQPTEPAAAMGEIGISMSPKNATITAGATLEINARVNGTLKDTTLLWQLSYTRLGDPALDSANRITPPGAVTVHGGVATYHAPAALASKKLQVTLCARSQQDTTRHAECSITVVAAADTTNKISIVVSPMLVTLKPGTMQQFSAKVSGCSNSGVTWRLVSGPGSVTTNGLYSAPSFVSKPDTALLIGCALADTTRESQAMIILEPSPDPGPCFERDIHPLFISNCSMTACHNPTDHTAGIIFTTYEGVMKLVVPGDTGASRLWQRITHVRNTLTKAQIGDICHWILSGAKATTCNETMGDCDTTDVQFSSFIMPTIQHYCLGCHMGRAVSTSNVDLSNYDEIAEMAYEGRLLGAICHESNYHPMPKFGVQLDSCSMSKIRAWVKRGAPDD